MLMLDDIDDDLRDRVYRQICGVRWQFGWKSNRATDTYCFLHQHYAGHINPDHEGAKPYDCESELLGANQVLVELWDALKDKCERLRSHRLIRCYANGYPYGTDGTVHTDTVNPLGLTTIFYPHPVWNPDWGGETVFFTSDLSDTRGWGQSPAIIDAGLFHSIYGTSQFKHASFPIEGRHIIRHLIGTKAEELAFEFCTLDRRRFPWGTFLPPERRAQLYTIEAANLIDQRDPPENIAVLMATGLLSQRVFDACAAYVVAHTEMHRDAS